MKSEKESGRKIVNERKNKVDINYHNFKLIFGINKYRESNLGDEYWNIFSNLKK